MKNWYSICDHVPYIDIKKTVALSCSAKPDINPGGFKPFDCDLYRGMFTNGMGTLKIYGVCIGGI